MQTCVIFNPSARGEKAEAFCSELTSLHPGCVVRRTVAQGQARSLAAQAVREGFSTVVAAGGDGTANEVVNGIGDVPGGFAASRLGILPLGTVNVFARELGLPRTVGGMAKAIAAGREQAVDLGRAEFTGNGKAESRYFLQLGGAGVDSRAIELVSWELKKKFGPLAYVWAGLRAAREEQPLITVEAGNRAAGQLVLLGNGRFYGGSFAVFPEASLQDGLLDICVIEKLSMRRIVEFGLGIVTGRLYRFCPALHLRSSNFKLSSDRRVLVQLDGENAGELPATFSVAPKVLRVIVP
ncbi:MAG TPA: diacylglycerol kinase family protein [Candidatus Baltobacteraceae bacterium]|nr:diacylglycerol kinase family protein [Candidatus Baltobacteraceae bacterium]